MYTMILRSPSHIPDYTSHLRSSLTGSQDLTCFYILSSLSQHCSLMLDSFFTLRLLHLLLGTFLRCVIVPTCNSAQSHESLKGPGEYRPGSKWIHVTATRSAVRKARRSACAEKGASQQRCNPPCPTLYHGDIKSKKQPRFEAERGVPRARQTPLFSLSESLSLSLSS